MDKRAELKSILKQAMGFHPFYTSHGKTPYDANVPINGTYNMIWNDPFMKPGEKMRLTGIVAGGARDAGAGKTGLITPTNLMKGALGVGVGYAAAKFTGKALGAIFGLPEPVQQALSFTGATAGFLKATGII